MATFRADPGREESCYMASPEYGGLGGLDEAM